MLTIQQEPTLRLGLIGFESAQISTLKNLIRRRDGAPRWRFSSVADADALVVRGRRACSLPDGEILVEAAALNGAPLRLQLQETARPVAFAQPLPADCALPLLFNPLSPASSEQVLRSFELQLKPLRTRFAIGRMLVQRRAELRHGVFHLLGEQQCQLLAVLDLRRGIAGLLAGLHPAQVKDARLERRLPAAGAVPCGFKALTTAQLQWTYVMHTESETLPRRYRQRPIHYRGVPRVPIGWLSDSQLLLLSELAACTQSFGNLCERTGLDRQTVERDLACLYFSSAITSSLAKAKTVRDATSRRALCANSLGMGADLSSASGFVSSSHEALDGWGDMTVPASIRGQLP